MEILHPQIAARNCSHCQKYVYDEETGIPEEHAGQRVERPSGTFAPCRYADHQCPKGTPENSRELNAMNRCAYQHYRECKGVGCFPGDPVVRRNAGLIRMVEDKIADWKQRELMGLLNSLLNKRRA